VRTLTLFIIVDDLINPMLYVVLFDEEVSRFITRLFDKDPPTARPATVLVPYCSENPPPLIMTNVFFDLLYFHY
jgi:hypothetical protein